MDALAFLDSLRIFKGPGLTVFEHGSCKGEESAGCLEHAHLQVVSSTLDLTRALQENAEAIKAVIDDELTFESREDYLFAGVYAKRRIEGCLARAANEESQYFRRVIARMIGSPKWDWHEAIILNSCCG